MLQPAKYEDLQLVCERRKRLGLMAMFPRHGLFALGAFILMLEGCLAMDEASPLVAVAVPALFGVAAVAVGAAELGPGGRIPGRRRPPEDRGGGGEPPARRPRANDAEANTTAAATAVVGAPAIGRNVRPRPNQRTNEGEAASAGPPRTDVIVNCTIS